MTTNKESVARLVEIAAAHGLKDVVFSPGSRNAPLVIAFNEDDRFKCTCIHDERAAAFFALGISQHTGKPTIIACTSGSAALNYAPAIAEAYYQQVPLLILTADRPVEWIDQGNGQTIRQQDIYGSHVKGSYQMLQEASHEDELWHNDRISNEAILTSLKGNKGPVHINIPLREPLYDTINKSTGLPKIISTVNTHAQLPQEEWNNIVKEWNTSERKLILVGQCQPDSRLTSALTALAVDRSVVVMAETTSNVHVSSQIACIDRTIEGLSNNFNDYQPDILLTLGGEIVSKKIKALLRKNKPSQHWHINIDGRIIDTYQSLTKIIPSDSINFLEGLVEMADPHWNGTYSEHWNSINRKRSALHMDFYENCEWSDFKVFGKVLSHLPAHSNLHLANSTPIRYHQLFNQRFDLNNYCNRGTSGIDGSTSTAAGMAYVSDNLTTIITGDTSFFYDSNALWIKDLPAHLRIILINNGGGNIFKIIPGPGSTNQSEEYFEAAHQHTAKGLAKTFSLPYFTSGNEDELEKILAYFFENEFDSAPILEIKTPRESNDQVLKDYLNFVSK